MPKGLEGKPKGAFLGNSLCGKPLDNACVNSGKTYFGNPKDVEIAGKSSENGLCGETEVGENPVVEAENSGSGDGIRAAIMTSNGNENWENGTNADVKKLVFFRNTLRAFDLEELLKASAKVSGKGTFGTAYKAVLEVGLWWL
ncbi:unnamed protein product [Fraxinus pennsylvanica]|uniref:Uncharacterized protein n=1 Tax=Fraxinus pennsylvanica TaxID=56036 RepID=A0AAD1YLJ9_9LAMI|nr:unnamed protein product [Fraxinus pennsylvanica]